LIRVSDLKLSERDIYRALGFFGKIWAFLFGGIYSLAPHRTDVKLGRGAMTYLPPLWKRMYFKYFRHVVFAFHKINGRKQYRVMK
jgi:hypothetical protein